MVLKYVHQALEHVHYALCTRDVRLANFAKGDRQNFNNVKIHTLEFRGSLAYILGQILTRHILDIASTITLGVNTSQIPLMCSATTGFIIIN